MKKFLVTLVSLLLVITPVVPAVAQVPPAVGSVNLSMTVQESLTVSTSLASLVFNPTDSTHADTSATPLTATATWDLKSYPTHNQIIIDWYFTSTAALSGTNGSVPTSAVSMVPGPLDNGGMSNCTGIGVTGTSAPYNANNCGGYSTNLSTLVGSFTIPSTYFQIAATSPLAAGNYTGTINVVAFEY